MALTWWGRRRRDAVDVAQSTPPPDPTVWEIGATPVPGGAEAALAAMMATSCGWGLMERRQMMRIPAVRRGRNVICGAIGGMPLRAWRTDPATGRTVPAPARPLLRQPESWRPLVGSLTWLVDDLVFYAHAWWQITRRDAAGWPVQVQRIEPWRVTWQTEDATGRPITPRVFVDGREVTEESLIRFDGPDEGLVALGSATLAAVWTLERSAATYADTQLPQVLLRYTGQGVLTKADAARIRDDWDTARRASRTAVLSANMTAEVPGLDPQRLQLVESRQYSALEVSRLLNLPPRYVGATTGDPMTYSNISDERKELTDLSLAPYIDAIGQRLSMGDVTPHGTVVRLDSDAFTSRSPTERAAYLTALVGAGIITPDQAAAMERLDTEPTMPGDDR